MRDILVTVCCTVYNHEKYLESALNGFVNQETTFSYEVIVHDDASTDNSAKIIKRYEEKYPDIIKAIYQKENQYSKGVRIFDTFIAPNINGKYVATCEGDDFWTDTKKLQKQVDFLEANIQYTACVHNTEKWSMRTGEKELMFQNERDKDIDVIQALQGGGACYHTSSLMYRVEYATKRPEFFYKLKTVGDYPLAIYLTLSGRVRFLNEIMSVYRSETEFSWTKQHIHNQNKMIELYLEICEMLKAVNEYADGQYSFDIEKLILKNKYKIEELRGNYEVLKTEPYINIYRDKNFEYKIKYFLKKTFPNVYQMLRKKDTE